MPDRWQLPAVLLATDIAAALADYDQRVRAIRLQQPPAIGLLLVESLRTAMNCGPHPALSWIRGCERIRLDLVLLFGIRALFARFPFNNYALQFHHDAARIDFMTRTDTRMLVGDETLGPVDIHTGQVQFGIS